MLNLQPEPKNQHKDYQNWRIIYRGEIDRMIITSHSNKQFTTPTTTQSKISISSVSRFSRIPSTQIKCLSNLSSSPLSLHPRMYRLIKKTLTKKDSGKMRRSGLCRSFKSSRKSQIKIKLKIIWREIKTELDKIQPKMKMMKMGKEMIMKMKNKLLINKNYKKSKSKKK